MLTVRTVQSLIREKKKGNEERIGRVGGGGEDEKKREGTAEKSEDCNGVGGLVKGEKRGERGVTYESKRSEPRTKDRKTPRDSKTR